jgi:PAS domain S-box-containing protein
MVNPALVKMLGYETAEEMYALDLATEIYAERAEHDRILKMIEIRLDEPPTSQLQRLETTWKRKDGKIISVRMVAQPSRDDQGRLLQAEVFVENVTEQKELEKQLQTAQKMEAIGQLAGGVAHDFNNLLMIIGSRAELIIEGLMRPERVVAQAEEIVRATRGAAAVTRQLLAFSRKQTLQPAVLNLNALLADLGKMLSRLIGEQIETRIITMPKIGNVKVDPGQFEQVIMNLAINARDAMPEGGELIIQTSSVDLDSDYAALHPTVTPGRYVLITVTDTGIGMDKETQAHIFEPFFTTKERGRGTGLGLAMVYGIVRQSGGHILAISSPGVGTCFKIYLPEVEASPDLTQEEQSLPAPGGSETILFVEDEKALRDVGCEFLRSKGYEVVEAANGAEALKILKVKDKTIHLLITDVIMPTMSGPELVKRAVALQPQMRTIYMSGYSAGALDGTDQSHEIFLQKPFSMTTLAKHTRKALDRPVEPVAKLT